MVDQEREAQTSTSVHENERREEEELVSLYRMIETQVAKRSKGAFV
jgi:hypothetical protein